MTTTPKKINSWHVVSSAIFVLAFYGLVNYTSVIPSTEMHIAALVAAVAGGLATAFAEARSEASALLKARYALQWIRRMFSTVLAFALGAVIAWLAIGTGVPCLWSLTQQPSSTTATIATCYTTQTRRATDKHHISFAGGALPQEMSARISRMWWKDAKKGDAVHVQFTQGHLGFTLVNVSPATAHDAAEPQAPGAAQAIGDGAGRPSAATS